MIRFTSARRIEREKTQASEPPKVLKSAEEVKAHLEAQLKQQRLAAQQVGQQGRVRLQDPGRKFARWRSLEKINDETPGMVSPDVPSPNHLNWTWRPGHVTQRLL